MSTTALISVDQYLRLTEKPYCEYRDGAVSPKAKSTKFHAIIQRDLMALLQSLGVQAFPELTGPYLTHQVSGAGRLRRW